MRAVLVMFHVQELGLVLLQLRPLGSAAGPRLASDVPTARCRMGGLVISRH